MFFITPRSEIRRFVVLFLVEQKPKGIGFRLSLLSAQLRVTKFAVQIWFPSTRCRDLFNSNLSYNIYPNYTDFIFSEYKQDMDTIKRRIAAYKDEIERKEEGNGRNLTSVFYKIFLFFFQIIDCFMRNHYAPWKK